LVSRNWLCRWKQWVTGQPVGSKRPGPVVSAGLLSRVATRGRVRSRSRSHSLALMTASMDINNRYVVQIHLMYLFTETMPACFFACFCGDTPTPPSLKWSFSSREVGRVY
jgi:hypothetical protein